LHSYLCQTNSFYKGCRFISGDNAGKGVALTTHPYLEPRLKKE